MTAGLVKGMLFGKIVALPFVMLICLAYVAKGYDAILLTITAVIAALLWVTAIILWWYRYWEAFE